MLAETAAVTLTVTTLQAVRAVVGAAAAWQAVQTGRMECLGQNLPGTLVLEVLAEQARKTVLPVPALPAALAARAVLG